MRKQGYQPEQIIAKLREVEILLRMVKLYKRLSVSSVSPS
jgi:hypothetical protein